MSTQSTSKPGRYGTLHLYEVSYQDDCDPDNYGVTRYWAYDAEHASEKFCDSADADGWKVTSVKKAKR